MKLDTPCEVMCPVQKYLNLRQSLQQCFPQINYHAMYHARFRASAT